MQPTIVACAYAPEGYEKILLLFLPPTIEQRVLAILRRVEAVSELYHFPDECIIPTPIADMKLIMVAIDDAYSAKRTAEEVKAKVVWANVTLIATEMEPAWAAQYAELIRIASRISDIN
ncbi:MAG TPA: hypothetical protein VFT59_00365 [Candidatus Saccharimonadales bacterium]|nr:hypothetical protein [Candidatus Saccharimonadales bacterium]